MVSNNIRDYSNNISEKVWGVIMRLGTYWSTYNLTTSLFTQGEGPTSRIELYNAANPYLAILRLVPIEEETPWWA